MKFRRCAIGGKIYGNAKDTGIFRSSKLAAVLRNKNCKLEVDFLTALAVCHTVVVERDDEENEEAKVTTGRDDGLVYRAESPDEGALVDGAAAMGYTLMDRSGSDINIRDPSGALVSYRILAITSSYIYNSSTRRKMLVLFTKEEGRILKYGIFSVPLVPLGFRGSVVCHLPEC